MIEQLGRFKHHPDLSTDFCCELESLEGYVEDIRAGGRSQWPFWARLSWLLKFLREGPLLDEIAERARPLAFELEGRAMDALRNRPALLSLP